MSTTSRQLAVALSTVALVIGACGSGPGGTANGSPGASQPAATATGVAPTDAASAPASDPATAPPASAAETDSANVTGSLTVLDWAGYDAEEFWIDFKEQYPNVDVGFEIGASDADIYSKMAAGDEADIFHPYTGWLQFYVDEGLVEEIDTSKLSNWDKVPDSFKEIGQIDGKQYFLPWDWGFTSVLYRTDKIDSVDSWSALMDPAYDDHISMWDDGPAAVTVSSYIHGYDETAITDEELAAIKDEWIAQRDLNLFYWAGEPELTEAMASGDVWAAMWTEVKSAP
jgi:spermidine/putrescine transport system substrate-binding protein